MLYGKCIFSQSGTPDFQNFLGSMDPPDNAPIIVVSFPPVFSYLGINPLMHVIYISFMLYLQKYY
jgi:hypothetical protein